MLYGDRTSLVREAIFKVGVVKPEEVLPKLDHGGCEELWCVLGGEGDVDPVEDGVTVVEFDQLASDV